MQKRQLQIIILGDGAVGKTSIINQYASEKFLEDHIATLGLDFAQKKYTTKADGKEIPIKIWDTAGQERFKTLTQSFYRKADGVIISFDLTEKPSFNNVRNWVESLNTHADKNAARVLVGNKIDLVDDRQVTQQEAQALADQYGIHYHETSAKANQGLTEVFEDIFEQSYANKFMNQNQDEELKARSESMKLGPKGKKKDKSGCCK